MYGKVLKYTQIFHLWATHFGKRTLKESKVFNYCLKITMVDLPKIGVKMRE